MLQRSITQTEDKSIAELRQTYKEKTEEVLPRHAKDGEWCIRFDHCFQRVILDNMIGDEWYDYIDGRPAYKQLTRQQLQKCIELADRMIEEGKPTVNRLNNKSLEYRGKA